MKKKSWLLKFIFILSLVTSTSSYTIFANEENKEPLADMYNTIEEDQLEENKVEENKVEENKVEEKESARSISADTPQTFANVTDNGILYSDTQDFGGIQITGYDATKNPSHPNLIIPDTINGLPVTVISALSFSEKGLTSVKLPKDLVFLGDMSFYKNAITSISIPGKVGTNGGRWDKYAFANNKLETVVLEEGLVSLGTSAFVNNKITSITFPSTLKTISFQAFAGNSLMSIDIPNTVSTIEGQAFYGNGILAPNIPNSVSSVAADAFKDQGRKVESVLKDDTLSYTLPTNVDISKITMTTSGVNVDIANRKITCPKTITRINYQYSLGVYGGTEVFLPAILELLPRVVATFVDYDDSVLEQKLLEIDSTAQPTVVPSRDKYTFIGWDKPLTNITDSTTFKAQYKTLPTLSVKDQKIQIGDSFNPLQGVKATDADGNTITTINVIENTVNTSQLGTYKVTLETVDQWGGKVTKEYQVTVEAKFFNQIITDSNSNVMIDGFFTKDARIIVELIPTLNTTLNQKLTDRDILESYEIHIIGEYTGEIRVSFPVGKELEGQNVIVYHEKKDGEIESFERVVQDGKVTITVTELSPFVITKDKSIEKENSKKEQKVNTNDNTNITMYLSFSVITMIGIVLLVYRKKER